MPLKDNNETNILLFDGVCNLCSKTVQFIIRKDPKAKFRFASLQSQSGQLLLTQLDLPPDTFNSLIYIRDKRFYLKSTAVLKVLQELSGGWRLLFCLIILPRFIRDFVYDFIAKRRYFIFGKSETCWIPSQEYLDRFLE
jgi:predicted DCC family thiol-disulfide oxidoreductase YuxK